MSEFGQTYRIYNTSVGAVRDLLDGLDGWSVSELKVYDRVECVFHETNVDPEPPDIFSLVSDEANNLTTLNLWKLEIHETIVAVLNKRKWTYLTYLFHTGAGFDELSVFVDGTLSLTEDLGEVYQFTTEDNCADLDLDYDRDDPYGRLFLVVDPPIRDSELKALTERMGPSAVVLQGWEDCVKEELPLHYLPGLD